ncbi:hypothetical protein ACPCK2_04025 [Streptomyces pseudogriseolus]|uniref:hypothetical protein n=1 Tax=Streptomyces pseudogriseolus TaxID=36817 RepID=UPI003FA2B13D
MLPSRRNTEQACRRTVDALTALPVHYRTGLVRRRALDLYEAIPAQHPREHAVRELRDVLAPEVEPSDSPERERRDLKCLAQGRLLLQGSR